MHLSNSEEEHVILALVRNFRKLIKHVLTKNELNHFKGKVKLIRQFNHLELLKDYINQKNPTIPWQPYLSLLSNIHLKLNSNREHAIEFVFDDLIKKVTKKKNHRLSNRHHYVIEHKKSTTWADTVDFFERLISKIKEEGINKIIIKTQSFCSHEQEPLMNLFEELSNQLGDGTLIIEPSDIEDFKQALDVIQQLPGMNNNLNYGLSFSINDRKTIYFIDCVFKTLTQKQRERFILRLKKGQANAKINDIISYEQQVTLNTYYKWSTYTIINYIRNYNCRCIINSNNLHDISWILARRAQMNMENTIQFETNISKFPNISKILYTINQASIPTESLFVTNNTKEKLTILLDELIQQGHIYHGYRSAPIPQKIIFIKSQRRFFNFLRRNYLKKYLNKYESTGQNH